MRILFAATKYPLPVTNGQAMRTLSLLRALAELGHEISLVGFAPEGGGEPAEGLGSLCRSVDVVDMGRLQSVSQGVGALGRMGCLLRGRSYSVSRFRSATLEAVVEQRLHAQAFDLIFADSLYALANVPATPVPTVLNCHNVEHLIYERFARAHRGQAAGWYARREGSAVRRVELLSCRRAALALVCSEEDGRIFHQLCPELRIAVAPNIVETEALGDVPPQEEQAPVLLFQGSMDWYPNRDAVEHFAAEILPLIRAEYPAVEFLVAGRNPPAALVARWQADPGVVFTGTVPDMRPYLRRATLAVVPLRLGSGTRLKILEACAAGLAVVSTTLGAEGLGLLAGQEILEADRPAEFAQGVLLLLRDAQRRRAMARAGQAAVRERFSAAALRASLQTALDPMRHPEAERSATAGMAPCR